jgi:hypothetical protein
MKRSSFIKGMLSVSALGLMGERSARAAAPAVIRIGVPGVGIGNRPILIDEYFLSQYKRAISDSKRFGLIKNDFSLEPWIEPKFLNQALKSQNLENYWQRYDVEGKPKA